MTREHLNLVSSPQIATSTIMLCYTPDDLISAFLINQPKRQNETQVALIFDHMIEHLYGKQNLIKGILTGV